MRETISINNFADLLAVSRATVDAWIKKGKYHVHEDKGKRFFYVDELEEVKEVKSMLHTHWNEEKIVHPLQRYTSVELFAGAGGLALGMEKAGFHHLLLNEIDHNACETLRKEISMKWTFLL